MVRYKRARGKIPGKELKTYVEKQSSVWSSRLSYVLSFPSPQKMASTSLPQLTSPPPVPRFRIPSGHSRTPLKCTQGAPVQESSTLWHGNLWHKAAAVFVKGLPCASPSPMTFSLAILLMPDTKTQATSTMVNFFKGSSHWLSLPLQRTLKAEIFSSVANHKQNWITLPGQDN